MTIKKFPDKYLQFFNQEVEILTDSYGYKIVGKLTDWDRQNIIIEQKVLNNPKIFSKIITIPKYMVKEIKILGIQDIKPIKKASHKPQKSQIPQEIKGGEGK